jgi:hypothetical protein
MLLSSYTHDWKHQIPPIGSINFQNYNIFGYICDWLLIVSGSKEDFSKCFLNPNFTREEEMKIEKSQNLLLSSIPPEKIFINFTTKLLKLERLP